MTKKVEDNQDSPQPSSYILLELDYSVQYLFPEKEGIEFLRGLVAARKVEDRYDKPLRIHSKPLTFKITIYTAEQLNVMEVQNGLLPEED